MAAPAERMKAVRERRRAKGLRELRLLVPDARSRAVRQRLAKEVAALVPAHELDALNWIEAISEFDAPAAGTDEAR
ncbi:MAG: antitoxin MazE-like protein [Beijerinckiaceae bacterium]